MERPYVIVISIDIITLAIFSIFKVFIPNLMHPFCFNASKNSYHWRINTTYAKPYTINTIESLNSAIRKAIKKRKLFLHDDSAKEVIYLAIEQASKSGRCRKNCKTALNLIMIEFEDRLKNVI